MSDGATKPAVRIDVGGDVCIEALGIIESVLGPQSPPEALYHYTSESGFIGMIESHTLWATHSRHLNDPKEHAEALEIARDVLDDLAPDAQSESERQVFDAFRAALEEDQLTPSYVFSLTEHNDQLSQWRTYGESGMGYLVGFPAEDLRQFAEARGCRLLPCIYEREQKEAIVRELFGRCRKHLASGGAGDANAAQPSRTIDEATDILLSGFSVIAPTLKIAQFDVEAEWRVVTPPIGGTHRDIRVRGTGTGLVPYFLLRTRSDEERLPLTMAMAGSKLGNYPLVRERTFRGMRVLLESCGYDVTPSFSEVPF